MQKNRRQEKFNKRLFIEYHLKIVIESTKQDKLEAGLSRNHSMNQQGERDNNDFLELELARHRWKLLCGWDQGSKVE